MFWAKDMVLVTQSKVLACAFESLEQYEGRKAEGEITCIILKSTKPIHGSSSLHVSYPLLKNAFYTPGIPINCRKPGTKRGTIYTE